MHASDLNPYNSYLTQAYNPVSLPESRGRVVWQSPSNIAIVKYWGKYGLQMPRNPSISFTLKKAYTETSVSYHSRHTKGISLKFLFEGKAQPQFGNKISKYLNGLLPYFPFIALLDLEIDSRNTFPHSSGIASSASSMSALIMCLLDIEQQLSGINYPADQMLQKASYLARLGSGSAARSVFPYAASWGRSQAIAAGSNYYATPLGDVIHDVFKTYHDSILIVSSQEKQVSSRAGHGLMESNPFAMVRYALANANTETLMEVLQNGDQEKFCEIAESEAMQLHALMMTSSPSFILMESPTISVLKIVQQFRKETGIPLCFTLDAGPNLHLLYPDDAANQVKDLITNELLAYCHQGQWIDDQVGEGPSKLD